MAVGEFVSLQRQAQLCSVPERDAIVQLLPAAKPNLVVHREHVQGKSWSRKMMGTSAWKQLLKHGQSCLLKVYIALIAECCATA